jgi:hypothetical protein
MDFNKKFNYEDINMFLPDNFTIGTTEYYHNRFPTLPEEECMKLEILSRVEYDEKAKEEALENLIKEQLSFNEKIENELYERGKPEKKNELEPVDIKDSNIEL